MDHQKFRNFVFFDILTKTEKITGRYVHIFELIDHLSRLNYHIFIFANEIPGFDRPENVTVLTMPFRNTLLKYLYFTTTLLLLSRKQKFDVLYSRYGSIYGVLGYIILKKQDNIFLCEVNGIAQDEHRSAAGLLKKVTLMRRLQEVMNWKIVSFSIEFTFPRTDIFIAVTEGLKRYLVSEEHIDSHKIHVVPNGVNPDLFRPQDQLLARERLNLELNHKYLLFSGNLMPWQGVEYLLHAMPRVLQSVPGARMLIVGDGLVKDGLVALSNRLGIADRVIFTGTIPYEQVPVYINASDVCVAPFTKARNEKIGLSPLKIYEYMACRKPVVASDIRGIHELLLDSEGGLLVPPEDANALSKAILHLLENTTLREGMAGSGYRHVITRCRWEDTAQRIDGIIHQNIASRSNPEK